MSQVADSRPDLAAKELAVIFADLDDSLFQTARKCGPGPLETAALGPDGEAASFFSPAQKRLFDIFAEKALVIPTTARNLSSFRRVTIRAEHGAILNHGGLILAPDGRPDPVWHERMRAFGREAKDWLSQARERAEAVIARRSPGCRARIISDLGLDFYVLIKNYNSRPEDLELIESELQASGQIQDGRIFRNDNNLSLLPAFLNKAAAVYYFLETHTRAARPDLLVIGLGDSLSDYDFLKLCDFMLLPSRSQLASGLAERGLN